GGLLVHGHVAFVAFAGVLTLYALLGLAHAHQFAPRPCWHLHKGSWCAFAAIGGLFLLPVALHTLLDFPGDVGKYLRSALSPERRTNAPGEVADYLVAVFPGASARPWLTAAVALAACALTLPRRSDGARG